MVHRQPYTCRTPRSRHRHRQTCRTPTGADTDTAVHCTLPYTVVPPTAESLRTPLDYLLFFGIHRLVSGCPALARYGSRKRITVSATSTGALRHSRQRCRPLPEDGTCSTVRTTSVYRPYLRVPTRGVTVLCRLLPVVYRTVPTVTRGVPYCADPWCYVLCRTYPWCTVAYPWCTVRGQPVVYHAVPNRCVPAVHCSLPWYFSTFWPF